MDDQPDPNARRRDGSGRFTRTYTAVARDADAARLRDQGHTYQQIADELGYCDKGEAWRAVQRAIRAVLAEPAEQLIATELAELDRLYVEALGVIAREHLMVSHGKVVHGPDGRPLLDDGPRLAAIDRAVKIRESYRKLKGFDAPSRVSVDAEQLGAEILAMLQGQGGGDDDRA